MPPYENESLWVPLVDEPIGAIVARIEASDPKLAQLIETPRRLLAFRTFAYIRVGILLGQMLVDEDIQPYDGSETWVETLMRDPRVSEAVAAEVRAVADEIAADPAYTDDDRLGPDDEVRTRFREFARKHLGER
jgi:hypothetical protein